MGVVLLTWKFLARAPVGPATLSENSEINAVNLAVYGVYEAGEGGRTVDIHVGNITPGGLKGPIISALTASATPPLSPAFPFAFFVSSCPRG